MSIWLKISGLTGSAAAGFDDFKAARGEVNDAHDQSPGPQLRIAIDAVTSGKISDGWKGRITVSDQGGGDYSVHSGRMSDDIWTFEIGRFD